MPPSDKDSGAIAPFSATNLDTSSFTTTKGLKLEPLTTSPGKGVDLSGKVETVKTDIKFDDLQPTDKPSTPEPDERYKTFFRVKIGGTSTVDQSKTGQPPASDAVAQAATSQTAGSGELKVISAFEGDASFYGKGDGFDGKQTANGEVFDASKLTAAHKELPFGTQVRVTNKANGKSTVVKINDRGPYAAGRVLDLSYAAAQAIDMVGAGHAQVKAEVLGKQDAAPAKPDTAPKAAPTNQATPQNPLAPDTQKALPSTSFTDALTKGNLSLKSGSAIAKTDASQFGQSALSVTQIEQNIKDGKIATLTVQPDQNLPDTAREFIFDSLNGEIIVTGETPYINLSSYQHSTAKFVIHDPDDKLRPQIAKLENVEIEAGFVNGYKINKFVGVIYTIGRRLPGGTEIEAIDVSSQLASTATAAVPSTNTDPAANAAAPTTASTAAFKVKSTFTGDASFYGKGDGFDGKQTANGDIFDANKMTAAHKELPFNTIVRVTNTANNKSVIVRVNDRGPYAAGRVLDLSYAAAQAIDMVNAGHASIKAEVLDAPVGTEVNQGKAAPDSSKPAATKPDTSKPDSAKQDSSKPVAPSTQTALTPDKAAAQTTTITTVVSDELTKTDATPKRSLIKAFAEGTNLKIAPESFKLQKAGAAVFQQSALSAAELEASLQGKIIVARGNTVSATAPGEGKSSGVTLDYEGNRSAFIGHPVVTKRTNRQLQSGYGAIAVSYYNMSNKQVEGAVVNTPAPVTQHPTGVINPPEWNAVLLSKPIDGQDIYTWADATKNGERVPESKAIMEGIIRIARILAQFTKESGQTKVITTSWYRDPQNNARIGGASDSRHMYGDAVDFYFDGPEYLKLFQKLWADGPDGSGGWQGGVAKGGGFIHLDDRGSQGKGRSRWYYPGAS